MGLAENGSLHTAPASWKPSIKVIQNKKIQAKLLLRGLLGLIVRLLGLLSGLLGLILGLLGRIGRLLGLAFGLLWLQKGPNTIPK